MLLNPFDVFETKFGLDDLHIAQGIDVSLHMDDFGIVESANDLEDAIDRTYVRKERISKPGACRRALHSMSFVWWKVVVMGLLTAVRPAISMHVKCAGTREAGL